MGPNGKGSQGYLEMTLLLLALALAAAAPPAAAPNATASAAAAAGPAVFLHIPKTAGASVRSALREYCDGHRPGRPAPRRCCLGQTTAAAADAAAKCDLFAAHVRFGVSAPVAMSCYLVLDVLVA